MQCYETILCVHDFFQSVVNAVQQLIQIGRIVERMHDFGDDLSLGFHAMKSADVQIGDHGAIDGQLPRRRTHGDVETSPTAIASAQTATIFLRRTVASAVVAAQKLFVTFLVALVQQAIDICSDEFFGGVTEDAREPRAGEENGAVILQNGYEFANRIQKDGKLRRVVQ